MDSYILSSFSANSALAFSAYLRFLCAMFASTLPFSRSASFYSATYSFIFMDLEPKAIYFTSISFDIEL